MAEFLYQRVVDWFQQQLAAGHLQVGDRMPSLRQVASTHSISLNTAIHAYEQLCQQGFLEARPKSGYFVRHHETWSAARLLAADDAIELSLSEQAPTPMATSMNFSPLLGRDLLTTTGLAHVDIGAGQQVCRQALMPYLQTFGIRTMAESIVMSRSAIALFTQALQALTEVNEAVLILTPCDPRLLHSAGVLNRRVITLLSGDRGVDLDVAKACIEAHNIKLVVLPSQFSVPMGQAVSNLTMRRWLALLKTYDVRAIEWDMCSYLSYRDTLPMAYKALDDQGSIVYIGGFEGINALCEQLAWCVLTPTDVRLMNAILVADLCPSVAHQMALAHALSVDISRKLSHVTRQLWVQAEKVKARLAPLIGKHAALTQAKGGHFLWLQLDNRVVDRLAECVKRPAICFGGAFSPQTNDWLGINLSHLELERDLDYLQQLWISTQATNSVHTTPTIDKATSMPQSEVGRPISTPSDTAPIYNPMLDLIEHDFG